MGKVLCIQIRVTQVLKVMFCAPYSVYANLNFKLRFLSSSSTGASKASRPPPLNTGTFLQTDVRFLLLEKDGKWKNDVT